MTCTESKLNQFRAVGSGVMLGSQLLLLADMEEIGEPLGDSQVHHRLYCHKDYQQMKTITEIQKFAESSELVAGGSARG